MKSSGWEKVDKELDAAGNARAAGFEGKARVCARRAAGIAFVSAGLSSSPTLEGIRSALDSEELPSEIAYICANLMKNVDSNFQLEPGIDLLNDVGKLVQYLKQREKFYT